MHRIKIQTLTLVFLAFFAQNLVAQHPEIPERLHFEKDWLTWVPEFEYRDTVKRLFVNEQESFNPTELAKFPNLKGLIIRDTPLRDLTFLNDFPELEILELYGNSLKTIKGIEASPLLKELQINHQFIKSIVEIGGLSQLEVLRIYDNEISDITPLADLENVWHFDIGRNPITSIDAIEGWTHLETFSVYKCNELKSVDIIQNFLGLTNLNISHLNLESFSLEILRGLKKLQNLRIQGMVANNDELKHISDLTRLEQLTMGMNDGVTNIDALESLGAIFYLDIHSCNIVDVSVIENFPDLVKLVMYKNQVKSVDALLAAEQLKALFLYDNPIKDYLPLGAMSQLQHLHLSRSALPMDQVKALQRLLPDTKISLI